MLNAPMKRDLGPYRFAFGWSAGSRFEKKSQILS